MEADPKHAETIIERGGVDKGNGVGTQSLVASAFELDEQEIENGSEEVPEEQAAERAAIRSNAMTAAYLSLDRPELLVPVKEMTRGLSNPQQREVQVFKRIARYLKRVPRLAQKFEWQPQPNSIHVYSDSDYAGCRKTRTSTVGIAIMIGKHCLVIRCKNH